MYTPNQKFFNENGAINYKTACAAGHAERSKFVYALGAAIYKTAIATVGFAKTSERKHISLQRI